MQWLGGLIRIWQNRHEAWIYKYVLHRLATYILPERQQLLFCNGFWISHILLPTLYPWYLRPFSKTYSSASDVNEAYESNLYGDENSSRDSRELFRARTIRTLALNLHHQVPRHPGLRSLLRHDGAYTWAPHLAIRINGRLCSIIEARGWGIFDILLWAVPLRERKIQARIVYGRASRLGISRTARQTSHS